MLKAGSAARRLSVSFDPPRPPSDLQGAIEQLLRRVDASLANIDPAWVGHCKLLVTDRSATVYGSITAAGDHVAWSGELPEPVEHAEITAYAAIYNISDAAVAAALDANLPGLA